MIEGQPELVEEAGEQARAQALGPHAEGLEVTPAHLGGEAVAAGAALMAHRKSTHRPGRTGGTLPGGRGLAPVLTGDSLIP